MLVMKVDTVDTVLTPAHPTLTFGPLLTEDEVATLLQATKRSVVTWRMQGKLPHVRIGRLVRYVWPDVVAHLKRTTGSN